MDIVGLGIKIVEQLVQSGLVKDVADLYTLSKDKLLQLDGFADKKAENLLTAIEGSKNQHLSRLLTALGIRGVGEVGATELARQFNNIENLSAATFDELMEIEGIGPNIAQAVVDWFNSPTNRKVLNKLHKAGVRPESGTQMSQTESAQVFSRQTFVITGTFSEFSRQEAKEFIEHHGGRVTGSVSKRTSYLVLGENPGSKYVKAEELGIPILDEEGLRKLVS
jgi:DNA ligase (NAD+)